MIKTFVMLGMHRSATSLIAEALQYKINIGTILEIHYENTEFIELNDRILKSAGGSWDNPPNEKDIIRQSPKFNPHIKKLIDRYNSEGKIWGWKDPRTCLTIRLYQPYLIHPHYIYILREPIEVAKSLQKRDGFSIGKGLKLTKTYNERVLRFLNEQM